MDSKEFLTTYLNDFSNLVKPDKDIVHNLVEVADLLKDVHADGKKILIKPKKKPKIKAAQIYIFFLTKK